MLSNVPQFIDTEDKIVGPFTAKQLGWMAAGGTLFLVAWNTLDTSSAIFAAIVIAAIFGALAFYRPYNQSFLKFLISSVSFVFSPKIYIWKRNYDSIRVASKTKEKNVAPIILKKTIDDKKIIDISKILDSQNR